MTILTEEQIRAIVRDEMKFHHDVRIEVKVDGTAVTRSELARLVPQIMKRHSDRRL